MPTKARKKMVKKAASKAVKHVKVGSKHVKKHVAVKSSKQAAVAKTFNVNSITKPFNRAQTVQAVAAISGVKRQDAAAALDALAALVMAHLRKRGPGEFTLLGLAKFRVVHKPAVKARPGVNRFTGESIIFKAKPARCVVKVRPLKKLKEAV